MYDHPDNVLNVETENATGLNDLQILVSNGVTNFIKSILVEKEQQPQTAYKIREPITLEDYTSSSGQISLTGVQMSGFPALKPQNPVVLEFGSSDAEELKRYRVRFELTLPLDSPIRLFLPSVQFSKSRFVSGILQNGREETRNNRHGKLSRVHGCRQFYL
jgi:hypothetical protein